MPRAGGLPTEEQILAQASKRAVQAAGGLDACEGVTGKSDSQISRCCSPNDRDSLSIRDAVLIDGIGHGRDGHPFILRAMCRILGGVYVQLPEPPRDADGVSLAVVELAEEMGDLAGHVRAALASHGPGGRAVVKGERILIRDDIHRMQETLAALDGLLATLNDAEAQ